MPKTTWFHLVPFSSFTEAASPARTDRERGSGHIWMQFPVKLTLKNPTETLQPEGKQGDFNITKMEGGWNSKMELLFYFLYLFIFQWTMVSVSPKRLLVLWPVKSLDLDKCDIFIWIYRSLVGLGGGSTVSHWRPVWNEQSHFIKSNQILEYLPIVNYSFLWVMQWGNRPCMWQAEYGNRMYVWLVFLCSVLDHGLTTIKAV